MSPPLRLEQHRVRPDRRHILHEVESMTNEILLIHQGRILAEGNVHQIRE